MWDKNNPYTLVYDSIIDCLKSSDLKVKSWNTDRNPVPDVVVESEMPELQLRPTGLQVKVGETSSSTEVKATYQILVNTGDNRLGVLLFPVSWVLTKAMYALKYSALENLKYNNQCFVKTTEVNSVTSGISDATQNRGATGWSAMWDIVVTMSFAKGDLI